VFEDLEKNQLYNCVQLIIQFVNFLGLIFSFRLLQQYHDYSNFFLSAQDMKWGVQVAPFKNDSTLLVDKTA